MKKSIFTIMAVCLLFLMTACGTDPSSDYGVSDMPLPASQEENSATSDASEMSAPAENLSEVLEPSETDKEGSIVYFTSDISSEGMLEIYESLGWMPTGSVAVKLSTGEPPASNYLRPELIKDLV